MVMGLLAMSASERERLHLIRAVSKRLLRQREGAERLNVSVRQVKRLLQRWRSEGDAGLISRQRGRVSPRRLDGVKRARIEEALRTKYPDFGARAVQRSLLRVISRMGLRPPRAAAYRSWGIESD